MLSRQPQSLKEWLFGRIVCFRSKSAFAPKYGYRFPHCCRFSQVRSPRSRSRGRFGRSNTIDAARGVGSRPGGSRGSVEHLIPSHGSLLP